MNLPVESYSSQSLSRSTVIQLHADRQGSGGNTGFASHVNLWRHNSLPLCCSVPIEYPATTFHVRFILWSLRTCDLANSHHCHQTSPKPANGKQSLSPHVSRPILQHLSHRPNLVPNLPKRLLEHSIRVIKPSQ